MVSHVPNVTPVVRSKLLPTKTFPAVRVAPLPNSGTDGGRVYGDSQHLNQTPARCEGPEFTRQNAVIFTEGVEFNGDRTAQGHECDRANAEGIMANTSATSQHAYGGRVEQGSVGYPQPRSLAPEFERIAREEGLVQGEEQDVAATGTAATTESVQEFDFTDADQVEQYGGDIFEQLRRFDNLTDPTFTFPIPAPDGSECRLRVYQLAWRLEYESSVGQGKRRRLFYKPLCYGNTTVIDPKSDMIPAHKVNSFYVANSKQFGTGPK